MTTTEPWTTSSKASSPHSSEDIDPPSGRVSDAAALFLVPSASVRRVPTWVATLGSLALLCAAPAFAAADEEAPAESGDDAPAKTAAPTAKKAPPPKRIHVQVFATEGLNEAERVIIERAVAGGVKDAGAKAVVTGYPKMKRPGGRAAALKALTRSDRSAKEAKGRVRKLDFDGALNLLDWAAEEYGKYLPELLARDSNAHKLVEVYVQTAIVSFLDDKKKDARKALHHAFVLKPTLDYDAKTFPPQMRKFVDEERLLFDESGKGSLRISLKGGPAKVYVNGIDKGKAPVVVHDLHNGPNQIVFAAAGVERVSMVAEVTGGDVKEVSGEITIPASKVTGPMAKVRRDVGMPAASKRMRRAGKAFDVKGMVLVVPKLTEGSLQLRFFVYDLRAGKLVGQSTATVERAGPQKEAEEAAGKVYGQAKWELALVLPPRTKPVGPSVWTRMGRRLDRVRHHKYFWHAVGATAGVITLGVIIKVAAGGGLSNGQKVSLFPITRF